VRSPLLLAICLAPALACGGAPVIEQTSPPSRALAASVSSAPSPSPSRAEEGGAAVATRAAPVNSAQAPVATNSRLIAQRIVSGAAQAGVRERVAELPPEGIVWVGALSGNGGRDVLIFIPPGADDSAQFRVVYHFHGTNSHHVQRPAPGLAKESWVGWDRLTQALEGAQALQAAASENVALVYPFSAGKRMEPTWRGHSNKAYDRMWMLPAPPGFTDDFELLHQEVTALLTEQLGVHPSKLPARVLVEGHSAGGIALWNIARSGARSVSDYLFLDAGFHEWADGCYAASRAGGADARVTLVIRDRGIADPMQGPDPWCVTMPALAASWPAVEGRCADDPKLRPRGDALTCARWRELALGWPKVQAWCAAMKDDLRGLEGALVHRTKVAHGEQTRVFFGGMKIPGFDGEGR
jgi:hypothetical protein